MIKHLPPSSAPRLSSSELRAVFCAFVAALSHAMARDGSSGGVIRMCTIDESGAERAFTAGDKLPYLPEQMY
jgi:hypothetical protein